MNMNDSTVISIITKTAIEMGIALPPTAANMFEIYSDILIKHNRHVNLTAIKNKEDIARLHFLDSLALLNVINFQSTNIIDIGSGAGFPGVPLKIAEPSIKLTLLDATNKRIMFLTKLCQELGIQAEFLHVRAEDAAQPHSNLREKYDIVVSRAVARLNILCELCLPFLRVGGAFPAMKGIDSDEELNESLNAIKILGAELEKITDYTIPETNIKHRIIVIRKVSQTPSIYPRRFAKIEKKPL